jgi:hypothetical protein
MTNNKQKSSNYKEFGLGLCQLYLITLGAQMGIKNFLKES